MDNNIIIIVAILVVLYCCCFSCMMMSGGGVYYKIQSQSIESDITIMGNIDGYWYTEITNVQSNNRDDNRPREIYKIYKYSYDTNKKTLSILGDRRIIEGLKINSTDDSISVIGDQPGNALNYDHINNTLKITGTGPGSGQIMTKLNVKPINNNILKMNGKWLDTTNNSIMFINIMNDTVADIQNFSTTGQPHEPRYQLIKIPDDKTMNINDSYQNHLTCILTDSNTLKITDNNQKTYTLTRTQ